MRHWLKGVHMLIAHALTLGLAAQFTTGAAVSSTGCFSLITNAQTTIVSTQVASQHSGPDARPRQGDVFRVRIDVLGMPQPCGTHLTVRPGFQLPAGVEFVPPAGLGSPVASCAMGSSGNLQPQPCSLVPTETLLDGTLVFDHPDGLWRIPDGQTLRIEIPVRSLPAQASTLRGYLDFTSFSGYATPLRPTAQLRVYYYTPSITYPDTAVTEIGPYGAHVYGYVDPHHNAGTLTLELAEAGGPWEVAEQAALDQSQFSADVDVVLEDLLPATSYQFRWIFEVSSDGHITRGDSRSFTTLPPPRFAYSATVAGSGSIGTVPAPESDGTFIDRTDVTLTASPAAGQRLVSFVVNGAPVEGDHSSVHVTGPLSASATFEAIETGEGEGEGDPAEGEGEGDPAEGEGEGEGEGDPAEGEGEGEGEAGEGEGEPAEGEDEDRPTGRDEDDEDDEGANAGGCAATRGAPATLAWLLLVVRRRRSRRTA